MKGRKSVLECKSCVAVCCAILVVLLPFISSAKSVPSKPAFPISLFKIDKAQELQWHSLRSNNSVRILEYNPDLYKELKANTYAQFELNIPSQNGDLTLELVANEVLRTSFVFSTDKNKNIPYTKGLYYTGKVKNNPGSTVAISLFDHEAIALIARPGHGNLVLGSSPALRSNSFMLFDDQTVKAPPFECQNASLPEWSHQIKSIQSNIRRNTAVGGCVDVYMECGYSVYTGKNSNTTDVGNYVSGLFNVVSGLYGNESINIALSEIMIWTSAEPYRGEASNALTDFGNAKKDSFNGDLAHFIRMRSSSFNGIAWVDVLCRSHSPLTGSGRYGYSEISSSYDQFPTYSWTADVVTHEIGHNLGSPHTQSCTWPGGPIDNCVSPEGSCLPGPAPVNGGTIMSYCHQTDAGVNFNNGFGPLPGDLIRNRVTNAKCLSGTCGGSDPPPPPAVSADLIITKIIVSPATVVAGKSIDLNFTIKNDGNASANFSNASILLSTDNAVSGTDIKLASKFIDVLDKSQEIAHSLSVAIDAKTPKGNYLIIICADEGNSIVETTESNNCASVNLQINAPPSELADLVADFTTVPPPALVAGQALNLRGTIKNIGSLPAGIFSVKAVLSGDNILSGNDVSLYEQELQGLAVGSSINFDQEAKFSSLQGEASYYLLICADTKNQILETDKSNNCVSVRLNVIQPLPDLIPNHMSVSKLIVPSSQIFSSQIIIKNFGLQTSTPFTTGWYLSQNSSFESGDVLLAEDRNERFLDINQEISQKVNIQKAIVPGNYFILVCADIKKEITESNELNNCASVAIQIVDSRPDLITDSIILSQKDIIIYTPNKLSIFLRNSSKNIMNPSYGKLYRSSVGNLDHSAKLLLTIPIPIIGADKSIRLDTLINLNLNPEDQIGLNYLFFCADADNQIIELDETNNCNQTDFNLIIPKPDLDLKVFASWHSAIATSSNLQIPFSIQNIGSARADSSVMEIYLADKPTIKNSLYPTLYLGPTKSFQIKEQFKDTLFVKLPAYFRPGSYYLNFCLDIKNQLKEQTRINNCQVTQLQLRNPYIDFAALDFTTSTDTFFIEEAYEAEFIFSNKGELPADSVQTSFYFKDLSDTINGDSLIFSRNQSNVGVEEIWSTKLPLLFNKTFANKKIELKAVLDFQNSTSEISESNNSLKKIIQVLKPLPDLQASNLILSSKSVFSGHEIAISSEIINLGNNTSGDFETSITLSRSGTNLKFTNLENTYQHADIPKGNQQTILNHFNLPLELTDGNYIITLCIDPNHLMEELNTTNNCIQDTLNIIQSLPDILITALEGPDTLLQGNQGDFDLNIQNIGQWLMNAQSNTIQLSADSLTSANDFEATAFNLKELAAGQSTALKVSLKVPDHQSGGIYYILVCLDKENKIPERNEKNNCVVKTLIVPPLKADLYLTGLQINSNVIKAGDTIFINNYIQNLGETDAPPFKIKYSLKTNNSDTLLYSLSESKVEGLKKKESVNFTSSIFFPKMESHNYYILSCLDSGNDIAELEESNNCGQLLITVKPENLSTRTQNKNQLPFAKLYPNPSHAILQIEGKWNIPLQTIKMNVTDISGHIIYSQKINSKDIFKEKIDIRHWAAGIYYIRLNYEGGTWNQAFLKN